MNNFVRYILICFWFFCVGSVHGQNSNPVDQSVAEFPKAFNSVNELAKLINSEFTTNTEKARAAFSWIAMNVDYDTKGADRVKKIQFRYRNQKELEEKKKQFRKDLALTTLKRRKALCEGYSTLYQELCSLMGIECVIVPGIAKRSVSEIGNKNLPSNHAWNAVKVNGKWLLVDATWAAGSVDFSEMKFYKEYSPAYFNSDPQEFVMKHYPDDPKWLLTEQHVVNSEFALLPVCFNEFIGKGILLKSPQNGILRIAKGKGFVFEFDKLPPTTSIAYRFKKERYGQQVKPTRKNGKVKFSVYPNNKGRDELIIFFNNEPALGFKVIVY